MSDDVKIEFEAIGTHWWITIFDEINKDDLYLLEKKLKELFQTFEKNYSRFSEDSFIGELNRNGFVENFPEEMYEICTFGEKVKNLTKGFFDICIGTDLESMGYDKNYSFIEKISLSINKNIRLLTSERIEIEKGTKIDLGGIGKGWIIDSAKKLIEKNKIKFFVINGGGDIYVSSDKGKEIKFFLENPFAQNQAIGEVFLRNQSIACSAGNKRVWKTTEGNIHHHLVDPKSGESVTEIASVFTLAENAVSADTASTAIFVSPPHLWEEIGKELGVEYLVVFPQGQYIKSAYYPANLYSEQK